MRNNKSDEIKDEIRVGTTEQRIVCGAMVDMPWKRDKTRVSYEMFPRRRMSEYSLGGCSKPREHQKQNYDRTVLQKLQFLKDQHN